MVLFMRELRRYRKGFITWISSLISANVLMLLFFPYMDLKADTYREIFKSMPEGMLSALNLDTLDFSSILSYFSYIFAYIILFSGIYAMQFGAGILSREENDGTIEFLLAKPVKRNGILTSKMLCLLFYLVIFNIIFAAADLLTFVAITDKSFNMNIFLLMHFGQFLVQMIFAALGLLISIFVTRTATIFPLSIGVVLGMYFVSIASGISEKLDNLKYISPFNYALPDDILRTGNIEAVYFIIACTVIAAASIGTYVFYNKKDIRC